MDKIDGLSFTRAYWVVPGRMAAGDYPGDSDPKLEIKKLSGLIEHGLLTVINLLPVDEADHNGKPYAAYEQRLFELASVNKAEVACLRFPIPELNVPSPQQMRIILDTIDQALSRNEGVYVHCWTGVGRTGTVVGCFLARHGLASGEGVLERLAQLRNGLAGGELALPEAECQLNMVKSWREGE